MHLYCHKAPISLAWRLVGDLLATRVSVGRGDVAATSPGDLAGREGVAVKSNMFDFSATVWRLFQVSSWSRRRRGDVAATKYVFEEEDVSATSPRPARDQMIEEKLRRRLRDVSATTRRRLRDDD